VELKLGGAALTDQYKPQALDWLSHQALNNKPLEAKNNLSSETN